ncbi:DUF1836 domain-containing protein [Streptococcus cameli]
MTNIPLWETIPELELYLDQVLLYVNQVTTSFEDIQDKPLTAAMVNNYVKHGYLPKPTKKKYGREHLARLIVLTLSKQVFAIADTAKLMDSLRLVEENEKLYNHFVTTLQGQEDEHTPPVIRLLCQTLLSYQQTMAAFHTQTRTTEGE